MKPLSLVPLVPLAALGASGGCAEDIAPAGDDDVVADAGDTPTGKARTTREPDGTYTSIVDAQDAEAWTVVDLETGAEATAGAPWDLQVQRFHLALNGGVSGDAGVEVVALPDLRLADVAGVPTTGWITDEPDGDDDNADPDYAFEQGERWYAYDVTSHVLTPRPITWVIRTAEGNHVALEIAAYYDDAGTSGVFTWRWAPLAEGGAR